jgi:hypothetical protein
VRWIAEPTLGAVAQGATVSGERQDFWDWVYVLERTGTWWAADVTFVFFRDEEVPMGLSATAGEPQQNGEDVHFLVKWDISRESALEALAGRTGVVDRADAGG